MPVVEYAVHPRTVGSARYDACREKQRHTGFWAQDGWKHDGLTFHPVFVFVEDRSSSTCRYDRSLQDDKCEACPRRGCGEDYDEYMRRMANGG